MVAGVPTENLNLRSTGKVTIGITRYSRTAIVLHWTIAAAICLQFGLGWNMTSRGSGPAQFWAFQLHKSVGITILLLSVVRLLTRLAATKPAPVEDSRMAKRLSASVHAAFYVFMIGAPLSGWALVSASSKRIPTLLFGLLPWPNLPFLGTLNAAARGQASRAMTSTHLLLIYLGLALLTLHIAGVVRHQMLMRDNLLDRMVPVRLSRGRTVSAVVILFLLAGLTASFFTGRFVHGAVRSASSSFAAPWLIADRHSVAVGSSFSRGTLGQWVVQPGGMLGFVARWEGQPVEGRFAQWNADIRFDERDLPQSMLKVKVALSSVTTGDSQRDETLGSDAFFDTATHPVATFESNDIHKISAGKFVAHGILMLHGVQRPGTVTFTLTDRDNVVEVVGATSLSRTDFAVGQGDYASTSEIAAMVYVNFHFWAKRA